MLVMLNRRNIASARPAAKFDDRLIGPFPIVSAVGSHAYRLDLGQRRIHPVFHVDLLHPYHSPSSVPSRPIPARPPPEDPSSNAFIVHEILDSRMHRRKLQYLVRWEGYEPEDDSWVPYTEFDIDDSIPVAFHIAYPDKPAPNHPLPVARSREPRRG